MGAESSHTWASAMLVVLGPGGCQHRPRPLRRLSQRGVEPLRLGNCSALGSGSTVTVLLNADTRLPERGHPESAGGAEPRRRAPVSVSTALSSAPGAERPCAGCRQVLSCQRAAVRSGPRREWVVNQRGGLAVLKAF